MTTRTRPVRVTKQLPTTITGRFVRAVVASWRVMKAVLHLLGILIFGGGGDR